MKTFYLLLSFLLFALCANTQQKDQLQGQWNAYRVEKEKNEMLNLDEGIRFNYFNSDIYIEGDSLWHLELPCKRLSVEMYSPDQFYFLNDSTFEYGGEKYSKRKTDTAVIAELKSHELNRECYLGKWYLSRTESFNDGSGVEFVFPFEVPDSIILTNVLEDRIVKLMIEGKEKAFYVDVRNKIGWLELVLTPLKSWPKDKLMWYRSWDLPPAKKRELKKIKREEGIPLELLFLRYN